MYIKVSFKSAKLPIATAYLDKNGVWNVKGRLDYVSRQTTGDEETRCKKRAVTNKIETGNPFGIPENPIHKEQLSNVLHVLLGERPVSFFNQIGPDGEPIRQRIPEIDAVAKKCLVKYDNNFKHTNKNGETVFMTETILCKKSLPSNNKEEFPVTWGRFKLRFINETDSYEKYISLLNSYSGKDDVTKEYGSLTECLKNIGDDKVYELKNILVKTNGLVDITSRTIFRPTGKEKYGTITVNKYPQEFISVDGSIIYDVNDDMYKRIITGTKCATILDGGMASLERWDEYGIHEYGLYDIDIDELLDEGYQRITDTDGEDYRVPENYFTTKSKKR